MTDQPADTRRTGTTPTADGEDTGGVAPLYGVGPFTIREVGLASVWLVLFVVSFFSVVPVRFSSVWTQGIDWILLVGVPTIAVFLVILRRLSPTGIRRVGSLGIDQFASVAFSVATVIWVQHVWQQVAITVAGGPWLGTWVAWVELLACLAGVVLTVFAPLIPAFAVDFQNRPAALAHRNARPVRAVSIRPRPALELIEPATPVTDTAGPVVVEAADEVSDAAVVAAGAADEVDEAGDVVAEGDGDGEEPGLFDVLAQRDDRVDEVSEETDRAHSGSPAKEAATQETPEQEPLAQRSPAQESFVKARAADGDVEDQPVGDRHGDDQHGDDQHGDGQHGDDQHGDDQHGGEQHGGDAATGAASLRESTSRPSAAQAFWALVPEDRDVVDNDGDVLFTVGPTAWALVIEDRGDSFVIRHEDGRAGTLRDVSGVTRG